MQKHNLKKVFIAKGNKHYDYPFFSYSTEKELKEWLEAVYFLLHDDKTDINIITVIE